MAVHTPSPRRRPTSGDRQSDPQQSRSRGLRNREIGAALFLGTQTVKTHVAAVLARLGVRDRTQAVIAAHDSGFLG